MGEMEATSHYVSAVHQGNWSVCDSYCQDWEGERVGVMERGDREGQREEEEETKRKRTRKKEERKEGSSLFFLSSADWLNA